MTDRGPAGDRHVPVLRDRVVELLAPALQQPGAVALDGTLGMGGHAEALLEACPQARVVGIDRDTEALRLAGERLGRFGDRFTAVHAVYDEVPQVLADLGLHEAHAVLFDLGVSSLQLDADDRGFAYRVDTPLDMRMDQTQGMTAADVLNTYSVEDLTRVLRDYGEERFARKIAKAVLRRREEEPFTTSGPLVRLLHDVVPAASQRSGGHPAKRTFQALRIEVNQELSVWARALPATLDVLAVGGRVAVLSYHSLEDRITKQVLAAGATSSAPPGLPVELPEQRPWLRLLTRGAEKAPPTETETNPRAASVRLRVAERLRATSTTRHRREHR
ncbi:16S rRNA (cytosine(1402)-N(4))-methyltransferase RsmH [Ornithinimicrobium sediminis]|uniref:16S rRNA (cytosine(1402)-N(4))-methyltransferase RsmH n=1 Tax=Ornithinimicrobium sediminis TaxID=2904603 RepID=UPI001E2C3316|nr:16S rRNA (cytosine(1402)-N(4))-methyltransferase RsmH [Ornithinimicrobium sediminis]MCE0488202.1 16S rRNA (cytosine(1402)-N(4))-methyltransferase RsmH [Ornithinimicrobium sediminis]